MMLNEKLLLALGAVAVYFDERGAIESWLPSDLDLSESAIAAAADKLIAQAKTAAKARIDAAAGRVRARYLTVAPGQEATYQAKAAEADAYVSAGRPADTSAYPILTAEAQARGIDVSQLADLVRETRDQWVQLAAVVEALRIGGKLAVDAAVDHDAVEAAAAQAEAGLEAV